MSKILEFYKSSHFMIQGWRRGIDNEILYKVLPHVTVSDEDKKLVIVTPEFLSRKDLESKEKDCLVIVLKHKLLKTAYWCDRPNYLFKKEKKADFQILY